jgi:hypothetical protein
MERHFMIDIEATGIDPTCEDMLAIGLLEATFDGNFWQPGRSKEWIVHTDRQPESSFAKEHMVELFKRCNAAPEITRTRLRWEVLEFLRANGDTTGPEDTYFMGWNASNFDLPFLCFKEILVKNRYEPGPDGKDRMVGDFHYRVYEIGGAVSVIQDARRENDRGKLLAEARRVAPGMKFPPGKEHDALYDCYRQLHLLNGLIELGRP